MNLPSLNRNLKPVFYPVLLAIMLFQASCANNHEHKMLAFNQVEKQNNLLRSLILDRVERGKVLQVLGTKFSNCTGKMEEVLRITQKADSELTDIIKNLPVKEGSVLIENDVSDAFGSRKWILVEDYTFQPNPFADNTDQGIKMNIAKVFAGFGNSLLGTIGKKENDTQNKTEFIDVETLLEGNAVRKIRELDDKNFIHLDFMEVMAEKLTLRDFFPDPDEEICLGSFLEQMNLYRNKILTLSEITILYLESSLHYSEWNFNKIETLVTAGKVQGDSLQLKVFFTGHDTTAIDMVKYNLNGKEITTNALHIKVPKNITVLEGEIAIRENGIVRWKPWKYIKTN